jgi:hypothetical protein
MRMIDLFVFGGDGRVTRLEQFDSDRAGEALARFDELVGARPQLERFANAAARAMREFDRCWEARDWDGVRSTYHPAHRMDDRRRLMRVVFEGGDFFANERLLFEDTSSRWRGDLLATRGERLALFRVRFTATVGESGPMEVEVLDLVEVDGAGRRTALVVFDPDDLEAAYAELDERYAAGEGRAHGKRLRVLGRVGARDWEALAAGYAPDFVLYDHRPLGWETMRGQTAYVDTVRSLVDLAPDVRLRVDHLTVSDRGTFIVATWLGSHEGGAFEATKVAVEERDALGTVRRLDQYGLDQLDEALARFAAIGREVLA